MMRRAGNTRLNRSAVAKQAATPVQAAAKHPTTSVWPYRQANAAGQTTVEAEADPHRFECGEIGVAAWRARSQFGCGPRRCQPVSGDLQAICQRSVEGLAP
jgi:hypothetical protein